MPVLRGRRFAAVLRMIGLSKVGEGEEGGTGMWGRCRAKLLRQGNKLFCRKMPAVEASPWKPRDIIPPLFVVGVGVAHGKRSRDSCWDVLILGMFKTGAKRPLYRWVYTVWTTSPTAPKADMILENG